MGLGSSKIWFGFRDMVSFVKSVQSTDGQRSQLVNTVDSATRKDPDYDPKSKV
ncbi:hypothetical protein HanPI659440_Chr15g0604841 [Helianthus annuus]|nr:hypothetical protein HanPI659440_Chr15g0604841 [Helianthus annuus]